jgi:uncharacterized protein
MIDGHVHLLGTGAGGTGCRLRRRRSHRMLEAFMLREMGLRAADLDGDFDHRYVERLLALVRDAGLSRILILAQEDVYDDAGRPRPDVAASFVPNDYVLDLARRHPEFVPAVSIHPARPDALEELERCLAGGAAMMKCLPNCQNIDPARPQYRRFWERMAEARLPLLAHTGGERVLPVVRPDLADPRVLRAPLEIGVTVIAAHGGTVGGSRTGFFPVFREMLARYPRLYGDVSGLAFPGKIRAVPAMLDADVVSRLIHGSDFPVPVQPLWAWLGGAITGENYTRIRRIRNPLARDIAWKRAAGFPDAVFDRLASLWRTLEIRETSIAESRESPGWDQRRPTSE